MDRFGAVPNTIDGQVFIRDLKKLGRTHGFTVRTYGRCHDKKKAFAVTGRTHSRFSNSNSIYSLKSPEAAFCYAWALYIVPKKQKMSSFEKFVQDVDLPQ